MNKINFIRTNRVLGLVAGATVLPVQGLDLGGVHLAEGLGQSSILGVPAHVVLQDHGCEYNAS